MSASDSATGRRQWLMLPVILSATFMAGFDTNVVNVAAPALQRDLSASAADIQLVIGGFAFAYASGLVTGGRLGDLLGYRRVFLTGMVAFTIASVLCGVAQNPTQLVVFRLVQGLTAALMVPQVLALITATFPPGERPRALSWLGVTIGLGGIAGQVLGGLLLVADLFGLGWRTIFLVNLLVGVVVIGFGLRLLPTTRSQLRPSLDPVGVVLISGSLALALVPFVLGQEKGWPAWTWICIVASVPVMAIALSWEHRLTRGGGRPLIDLSLFTVRSFSAGLTINFAFMAYFVSFLLTMSLLLQEGLGLTALQAGLAFAPLALLSMLTSLYGRGLAMKYGVRLLVAGCLIDVVALLALAVELQVRHEQFGVWDTVIPFCLAGIGSGLLLPSLIGIVLSGVRPDQAGAASGVLTTTQQFAGSAGVAVIGAVFFTVLDRHVDRGHFATAAAVAVWLDLALVAAMIALTTLLPRPPKPAVPPAAPVTVAGRDQPTARAR